jgi:hypothetical protein
MTASTGSFELYHLGIVVTDVSAAMEEYRDLLGLTWGRMQYVHPVNPDDAERKADFVFSLGGPPYYELVRARPETVWSTPGLHHLGVWCDDLTADAEHLLAAGWQWEQGKYFLSPTGVRHELVPRASYQPRLRRYLDGYDMFAEGDAPESYRPSVAREGNP